MQSINSVANSNSEGYSGRDDLDITILRSAEGIKRRVSVAQSKAVRALADQIKKSFVDFRKLLKKYESNIEVVDPQLKNNPDLVEVMQNYESSWEKGKEFLTTKLCNQLIHFSSVIEGTMEKYEFFKEQVDTREAEIFITIPCLLILKSFEDTRGNKELIHGVAEKPMYIETKSMFLEAMGAAENDYEYYNNMEKMIIEGNGNTTPSTII